MVKSKKLVKLLVSTPYGFFDVLFPSKEDKVYVTFVYDDDSQKKVTVFDPEKVITQNDSQVDYR